MPLAGVLASVLLRSRVLLLRRVPLQRLLLLLGYVLLRVRVPRVRLHVLLVVVVLLLLLLHVHLLRMLRVLLRVRVLMICLLLRLQASRFLDGLGQSSSGMNTAIQSGIKWNANLEAHIIYI